MIPIMQLKALKFVGKAKIWSTNGATVSAIATFLKNPHITCVKPSKNLLSTKGLSPFWNCGKNCLARTIGPATSCGKNDTKVAYRQKFLSALISFLYTSIV